VQACPTGALRAVKQDDEAMQASVRDEALRVLRPELGTRPRVYYRNLHRFDQCFIGGSVVADVAGVTECMAGAAVVLRQDGREIARTTTDTFGDFKFDALEPGSGAYRVEISHPRYGAAEASCTLGDSVYLGNLRLAAGTVREAAAQQEMHQ
jgi:hypothetical protein